MAGLVVRAEVHSIGSVHADLAASAEEVVMVVETAADPCQMCANNADDSDPRRPPLHPNCRCVLITTTVGEIFREAV